MDTNYVKKQKLCPFMSTGKDKVYCTSECAFVAEHYDADSKKLIGITCGAFSFEDTLESINQKLEILLETR